MKIKPPTKNEVALSHLLDQSLNTFEANRLYGDTCLHSTISLFENSYGFSFRRSPERIANRVGTKVTVTRYRLMTDHEQKAKNLVRQLREKRGAKR